MPNGKSHDHPVTDTVFHGLHPFPPDLEALVIQVHPLDPGLFNDLGIAPFDWENGKHLPAAQLLLEGILRRHGDPDERRRLLDEYRRATGGR